MSRPTPAARLAARRVLIDHQRTGIEGCLCGWGSHAGQLGMSHSDHVVDMLDADGIHLMLTPTRARQATAERIDRRALLAATVDKATLERHGHVLATADRDDLVDMAEAAINAGLDEELAEQAATIGRVRSEANAIYRESGSAAQTSALSATAIRTADRFLAAIAYGEAMRDRSARELLS